MKHNPEVKPGPAVFFGLTFVLSWLIWVPLALSHLQIGAFRIPESTSGIVRLLGVLMPAVSALLLTGWYDGRGGLRRLLGRLAIWRLGWQWWVAGALVQPALLLLTGLLFNAFGGVPPVLWAAPAPAAAWAVNIFFLLLATLGEEIGWRGAALPALQQQHTPLKASAILGAVWAVWHIPFWLLMDTTDRYGLPYLALNLLFVFPGTFYITWFFNHTRASLLLPVAFHLGFNIVNTALLPVTASPAAFGVLVTLEWVIAAALVRHMDGEHSTARRPASE